MSDPVSGDVGVDLDDVRTTADYADRRADSMPDALALVDRNRELTWAELKHASDRLATGLLDRVGAGAVVFEQLYDCVELYVLRLACEKAGVRLLTAPRTFRTNEIAPLFSRLRPELAIVPGTYRDVDYVEMVREVDPGSVRSIATLDDTGDERVTNLEAESSPRALANARIGPDEISQLALTSGSSGTPTCVEVPPGPRVRTGIVQARRYGITRQDVVGVVTPLVSGAPDATAYHGAPVVGATVVLFDRFDPPRVCERIREDLTVLPAVPTVTAKLLDHVENESTSSHGEDKSTSANCESRATSTADSNSAVADSNLEMIVNYGDVLSRSVGERAERAFGCRVHQAFGTADYGGICATSAAQSTDTRLQTVGQPLERNQIAFETDTGVVEDPDPGETGSLLVRGAHRVGRALVGHIEETGSYFRVGLHATVDEEGRLIPLGREREVIIRGGRNIYPAEIENALQAHPAVAEAAVVGAPDETFGERPCAFVVAADGATPASDELLAYLRDERELATFKRPERITVLESLPMVPAGHKVDKKALRRRAEQRR